MFSAVVLVSSPLKEKWKERREWGIEWQNGQSVVHNRRHEASILSRIGWAMRDLNPRPPRCKRGALAN